MGRAGASMTSHGGTNDRSSTSHGDAAHTPMPGYIQPSLFGDGDITDINIMTSASNPDINRGLLHSANNNHTNTSNTNSALNSNISPNSNSLQGDSHTLANLSNLSNFSNLNNLSNLNTPDNSTTPNNLNFNNNSSGNQYSQMDDFGFDLKNDQYDYFSQVSLLAPSSRIDHVYGLDFGDFEKSQQKPQGNRQQPQGQQTLHQPLPLPLPQYGQNLQSQLQSLNQVQNQLNSPEQRVEQEFQNYHPRFRLNQQHSLSQEVVEYPNAEGYQPKRKHSNENDSSVSDTGAGPGSGSMTQLPYPPKPPTIRQNSLPLSQKAMNHNHKKNHGANGLSFFGYSSNPQIYGNENPPNSGNSQNAQIPQNLQNQQKQNLPNQYNSSSYNDIDLNTSQKSDATVTLGSPSEAKKRTTPKPRGRPRKNRNPGFFLPLDNLNTKNQLAKVASNSISSSHSDTAAYNWNRSERVNNSGTRNFSANIPLFKDDGQHTPNPELRLFEADLGLQDDSLQRFAPSHSNITPSMNPPLNVNGYFELENRNINSNSSNSNSQFDTSSLLTHFISPHINYNEHTFNNFNKEFEDYLSESGADSNLVQQRPVSGQYQLINKEQISMSRGVPLETDPDDVGFGADLGGFNFDVNPRNELLDPESLPKPTVYDNNELVATLASSMLNPTPIYDDNDALSVNQHGATSLSQSLANGSDFELSESDRESKPSGHLDVPRPVIVRSISNHSGNSNSNSNSLPPQEFRHDDNDILLQKPKKKRLPKGAVCSICDKYISRDLTRHMRIHNEVGRFQCVYPKYMCNHKTQYFNRPYDYKKHLLHMHFRFDDPKGKTANTLTDKLPLEGICIACGARFVANDWLETHVLTNSATKCPSLENRE